jgi:hypothetical protein
MHEHRRDHICVVNLLARAFHCVEHLQKLLGDLDLFAEQPQCERKARTLPRASAIARPSPLTAIGRVATARYSRRICPLV